MNPILAIILFTCMNRLYRLAFYEKYVPEKELKNFGYTAVGVAIVYAIIWICVAIIIILLKKN